MTRKTVKNRTRILINCLLMCLLAGASLTAAGRRGGDFHRGGFHGGSFHGGGFHDFDRDRGFYHPHFWGGFYLGSDWFWGPTVVIEDVPYYYYNGGYYTTSNGEEFIAVAPPMSNTTVAQAPKASTQAASTGANEPAKVEAKTTQQMGDTVTINVPKADGGYTAVKLIKHEKGYVGPQGEFYPDNPTVAQLKALYGK